MRWIDWVDADELPGVVAEHDVCLGIFGTTDKAPRVVPNKVYQGVASGCAVVTSDTPLSARPARRGRDVRTAGQRPRIRLPCCGCSPTTPTALERPAASRGVGRPVLPASVVQPLVAELDRRLSA